MCRVSSLGGVHKYCTVTRNKGPVLLMWCCRTAKKLRNYVFCSKKLEQICRFCLPEIRGQRTRIAEGVVEGVCVSGVWEGGGGRGVQGQRNASETKGWSGTAKVDVT